MKITIDEYIKILDFYNLKIPTSNNMIKIKAEKIIQKRLCKYIDNKNDNNNKYTECRIKKHYTRKKRINHM